jgi:hypothetical protein
MGTQQILLIVLSVIIVGIAVAVGITMFNQQAKNQNRNSCISDMNNFAAQTMAWFKTPQSHGGAGNSTDALILTLVNIGEWVGFNFDGTATYSTDNGTYVSSLTGTTTITWQATGTEFGVDPRLVMTWADGSKVMTLDVDGTQ